MPRKDEVDRCIILIYASRNGAGFTNFNRPYGWLDGLPMGGLKELSEDFERYKKEVDREIEQRIKDGIPTYSRKWHDKLKGEEAAGAALLRSIGVNGGEVND